MRSIDEIIVCVFPCAERSDAVQFVEQHSIQQVVDGVGIVRMPLILQGELLNRAVIFHVIKMNERLPAQGFLGSKCDLGRRGLCCEMSRRCGRCFSFSSLPKSRTGSHQDGKQSTKYDAKGQGKPV